VQGKIACEENRPLSDAIYELADYVSGDHASYTDTRYSLYAAPSH
jgi:hypothetical protein